MSDNPFNGPQLQSGHYIRADMTGSNFDGVNLADSQFFAVMTDVKFTDTNLGGAYFDDVNLGKASFNNINFNSTTIQNANMSEMTVSGVNLFNTTIDNADLTGMKINGVLVTDLFAAYGKGT